MIIRSQQNKINLVDSDKTITVSSTKQIIWHRMSEKEPLLRARQARTNEQQEVGDTQSGARWYS